MAYQDMTPGPPPPAEPPPATSGDTGSTATGSFDVDGAKKAGYSDAEIADHLAATAKFDATAARKSGYSDKELIAHLTAPQPTGLEGYPEESFQAGYAQSFPQPAARPAAPPAPLQAGPARGGFGDPGTLSGAVAEGFRTGPRIVDQPAIDQADQSGLLGHFVTSPLLQGVNLPLQLGNAAWKGGQATIESLLTPLNPLLGTNFARDVAAMPEAFPTGVPEEATYSGRGTTLLRTPPAAPPAPQFVQQFYGEPVPGAYGPPVAPKPPTPPTPETFVPPGTPQGPTLSRIHELIQADIEQAQRRPAEIPPTTTKDPVTGEVQPIQQPPNPADRAQAPQPEPQAQAPQTVWRSQDHDFPVEPTGVTQAVKDGRIYAQVRQPDGTLSYVPHDELVTTQPAGAQVTPAAQSALTPEQEAAAGSTADKQWYYKTIIPGEADRTQYLKGINPTMAQQELTTNAARDSKLLRRISEDADQNERNLLGRHSEIRKGEFQDIAGSDTTQETALDNANKQIEAQLQAAYAHGGTVDLQPVVDAAKAELTGSAGKLPPVKAAMKEIQDAAQKSDGTGLETDPRQANAVRRTIIYMQSKKGQVENPGYGDPDVMAALTRVKDVLTKQIEPAAPGFTEANANYAKARQAINAREALQAYEPKLYQGPLGNMTFAPFHRLMGDVIAGRDPGASPINPYKALTEEQMNRLKSLHDDLQRVASAEELARAAGSDTSTTMFDMAKKAVKGGLSTLGGAGVGMLVGHLWPEAAVSAGMFTKSALDSMFSQRAVRQATAEHNRLLQPDLTQYPLKPNPLMNPPPP